MQVSYHQKQSCPVTLNNSNEVSFQQPARKFSIASLNNQIDIDKVMIDIKLIPLKSNEINEKIYMIYQCLEYLKRVSPNVIEQVRTAELILQNIQNKLFKKKTQYFPPKNLQNQQKVENRRRSSQSVGSHAKISTRKQSLLEQQILLSKRKSSGHKIFNSQSQISPIKQLDDRTSRIDIQSQRKYDQQDLNPQQIEFSIMKRRSSQKTIRKDSESKSKINTKQPILFTVSKFDPQDQQIQRLTKNIQALDKVLEQKGLGLRDSTTYKNHKNQLSSKHMKQKQSSNQKLQKKLLVMGKSQKKHQILSQSKSRSNKQNWYC